MRVCSDFPKKIMMQNKMKRYNTALAACRYHTLI